MTESVETRGDDEVGHALEHARESAQSVEMRRALANARARLLRRDQPVTLSRYVLLERLGAGGRGVVYRAYDPALERKVAIKLVRPDVRDEDPKANQARLMREAQAIAQLAHPNVVAVHDVGTYDERDLPDADGESGVFIVMELIEGQTLAQWLAAEPRHWSEIQRVFVDAGRGLAAAHERDIVHRDFKPSNVLIGTDGRIRVLDFGLARSTAAPTADVDPSAPDVAPMDLGAEDDETLEQGASAGFSTPLTVAGVVMGTPAYMAPEQHRGQALDARADQYGFCVALYESLYGQRPFVAPTTRDLETMKSGDEIADPPSDTKVPDALFRILARGLASRPGDRFPTMHELLAALDRDPHAMRRRILWSGLAGGVIVASGLGWSGWQGHREQQCLGQEHHLVDIWDEDARTSIRTAFEATGASYATKTSTFVEQQLDDYANEWIKTRQDVCAEARVRSVRSPESLAQAYGCLDDRLASFGAVAEFFATSDQRIINQAGSVLSALRSIEPCGFQTAPDGSEAANAELAERRRGVSAKLALSASKRFINDYAGADALASEALAEARATDDRALEAQALLTLAQARRSNADLLYEAWAAAERAGSDRTTFEVLTALVFHHAWGVRDHDEAERILAIAEARFERNPLGKPAEALLAQQRAITRYGQGRNDEAIEAAQRSIALFQDSLGEHPLVIPPRSILGNTLARVGRTEEAATTHLETLELVEKLFGSDHPHSIPLLVGLADCAVVGERMEEAIDHVTRAMSIGTTNATRADAVELMGDIQRSRGNIETSVAYQTRALTIRERAYRSAHPLIGQSLGKLAESEALLQRFDDALRHADRSLTMLRERLDPEHEMISAALDSRGYALLGLARTHDALRDFEEAHRLTLAKDPPKTRNLVLSLAGIGLCRVALGEGARAVDPLKRAIELTGEQPEPMIADARLALARLLRPSDPVRARALAQAAHDLYAHLHLEERSGAAASLLRELR